MVRTARNMTIRDDCKWNHHIFNVNSKAAKRLYLLSQLKRAGICASHLVLFCCSTTRSVLEYACKYFTPVFRTICPRNSNVFRSAPCALSFLMQATTADLKRQASLLFLTGERLYRLIFLMKLFLTLITSSQVCSHLRLSTICSCAAIESLTCQCARLIVLKNLLLLAIA